MNFQKSIIVLSAAFIFSAAFAQKTAPNNWFNLDPKKDKVYGVSSELAYSKLLKNRTGKTVVVAVIDGGTDPLHEDLRDIIWVNPKEIPGNGIDDDKNGYADDINGWNFIGNKDGRDVNQDNLEVTRVYARLKVKYENVDSNSLSASEKKDYYIYLKARKEYFKGKEEASMYVEFLDNALTGTESIRLAIGKQIITVSDIIQYAPTGKPEMMAQMMIQKSLGETHDVKDSVPFTALISELREGKNHFEKELQYSYNTELNTREIVGDNYEDITERYYGNNDVKGPSGGHGTHVAGIIAAVRNNNIGINGVAQNVKIMIVRVVPDGDERDKDVANGIRYAVDNGATVINMSFGKSFSYNKKAVDDAVKYAASKDVLLVHAAGNDAQDNDKESNFPNPVFESSTERAANWIEVGASSWMKENVAAGFSNYGKNTVDVFAPGVDIYSTVPDSKYESNDGTSMASPVTAGVAALVRSYYPNLTAIQVKEVILKSVTPVKEKVLIPGTETSTKMSEISRTGGIVNAYKTLKLAKKYGK